MVLGIALTDGYLHLTLQGMLVDLGGRVGKFNGEVVHKALHEVTLTHEKILPETATMAFEFVLEFKYL